MGRVIRKNEMEFPCTMTVPVELSELRVGGAKIGTEERKDMLRQLRAGEVFNLTAKARVYLQPKVELPLRKSQRSKANANFARFADDELEAFAASFAGERFLRDHNTYSMAAVGGRIASSSLVELADEFRFVQELELVKPWAIEDALDGTMSTFSIGWRPMNGGPEGWRESLCCSVCGTSLFDCRHFPGQVIATKNLQGEEFEAIVEVLWRKVRGAETSEVSFPAVKRTGVESVRAALSAMRLAVTPASGPHTEEPAVDEEIRRALGLSDKAEVKDAVAAILAMKGKLGQTETQLAEERRMRVEIQEKADKDSAAARASQLAELRERALNEGRWIDGDADDQIYREVLGQNLDAARRFFEARKPSSATPVGRKLRSETPAPISPPPHAHKLTASEKQWAAQRGMTEEQYVKYAYAEEPAADGPNEGEG